MAESAPNPSAPASGDVAELSYEQARDELVEVFETRRARSSAREDPDEDEPDEEEELEPDPEQDY